jgi:hypothetical protein
MVTHKDYVFSATFFCNDLAVVSCLRGLAWYCQVDGHKTISWGNVKEKDWRANGCKVTFHFTRLNCRDNFLLGAKEIFGGKFDFVSQSNDDPAERASK